MKNVDSNNFTGLNDVSKGGLLWYMYKNICHSCVIPGLIVGFGACIRKSPHTSSANYINSSCLFSLILLHHANKPEGVVKSVETAFKKLARWLQRRSLSAVTTSNRSTVL